jgi:glycerophosphoryl diester phosphodiesterase
LYAHRGAAAERPENTLPSFRRALELGADALEMDIHLTRDGHIVVSHDADGSRMAGVVQEIRAATLAEVKAWDVGQGFVDARGARPYAGAGFEVPTLDEVLTELADVPLNIDIKQRQPPMVEPTIELLRRRGAEERVTLASFHAATLRDVRRRGYRGPTALAQAEVAELLFMPRAFQRLRPIAAQAAQLPVRYGGFDLGAPWVIARCHDLGLRVDYWTVNDPAEARRLLDNGADGIMTDDPAVLAPTFRQLRK